MSRSSRSSSSTSSTIGLAGWLFADLLLAIGLLFLVTQTGGKGTTALFATPSVTETVLPSSALVTPSYTTTPPLRNTLNTTPTIRTTLAKTTLANLSSTPTAAPTVVPTQVPTPIQGLQEERKTISIRFDANVLLGPDGETKAQALAQLRDELDQAFASYRGQKAAIVLTFGGAMDGTSSDYVQGQQLAKVVNEQLPLVDPSMFTVTATEELHDLNDPLGTAYLWVWFFIPQ